MSSDFGVVVSENNVDWTRILTECAKHVKSQVDLLLPISHESHSPSLGIGAGGDPIKQVDLAAENAIVDTLRKHDISFTLVSEESGVKQFGDSPNTNFVTTDPVDGTTNLSRGIPFYATSIAVSSGPQLSSIHSALVADLFHETIYTARSGEGARKNGARVKPSKVTTLDEAVIGLDLNSYRVRDLTNQLTALINSVKHIRHFGANSLEMCYVADGITDAFVDIRGKLRTTDMAASWLIIREAGAQITAPDGSSLDVRLDPKEKVKFVSAGNLRLHVLILELIRLKKES